MCARQRTTLGNPLSFHLVSHGLSCFCCCAAYARRDGWQASRQLCVYLPLATDIIHVGYRGELGVRLSRLLRYLLSHLHSPVYGIFLGQREQTRQVSAVEVVLRSRLAYPVQYDRLTCTPPIKPSYQNLRDLTWGVGSLHCRSELV